MTIFNSYVKLPEGILLGNMAGKSMDFPIFPALNLHKKFEDFPASHVWFPEGRLGRTW